MKTTTQREGGSLAGPTIKIALLGAGLALAIAAALPLVGAHAWGWLAVLAATTTLLFYIYLTPRHIPAKYLFVGTIFLLAFQIAPVIYTVTTAFTNFGDGHRGSKAGGDRRHRGRVRHPGPRLRGVPARRRHQAQGAMVFLLIDETGAAFVGTETGCTPRAAVHRRRDRQDRRGRRVHGADHRRGQPLRSDEILAFSVPTRRGRDPGSGAHPALSRAWPGRTTTRAATASPTRAHRQRSTRPTTTPALRRRRTASRLAAGLEGRRRLQELRRRLHQRGDRRARSSRSCSGTSRSRSLGAGDHVRASACGWRWCSTRAAAGPARSTGRC